MRVARILLVVAAISCVVAQRAVAKAASFRSYADVLQQLALGRDAVKEAQELGREAERSNYCHRNHYRKHTMKVIKETPFIGLFPTLQGQRRFEASGITYARGAYWVVFDNLQALGKLDLRFNFRGEENALVGPTQEESQYEGLAYLPSSDTFLALRESFEHKEHGLIPLTVELQVRAAGTPAPAGAHAGASPSPVASTYQRLRTCAVRFTLQDGNKGFESLHAWDEVDDSGAATRFMIGLCESNHCATVIGHDPPGLERGNGRIVIAKYEPAQDEDDECRWEVVKVARIPSSAYFTDYSAIAFNATKGAAVAITSQEDAAVWVGTFDWQALEFAADDGEVYHFPRDEDCEKVYCNVEGVAWLDASRLVLTSDRSKKTQDHRCMEKDQSVHVMALP